MANAPLPYRVRITRHVRRHIETATLSLDQLHQLGIDDHGAFNHPHNQLHHLIAAREEIDAAIQAMRMVEWDTDLCSSADLTSPPTS